MYNATIAKDLSDLKRFTFGPHLIVSALLGGLIPTVVGEFAGPQAVMYSLMVALLFTAVWAAAGIVKFKPEKGELLLNQETLRLKWMDNEAVEVALTDVSPTYMVKSYRPMGIFPKKNYIHLLLEGGQLGPHSYFFVHDGEYNASQWEKLPLQQIEPTSISIGT